MLESDNWLAMAELHERKALETSDPVYQGLLLKAAKQWRDMKPGSVANAPPSSRLLGVGSLFAIAKYRLQANVMNFFRLF